MPSLVRSLLFGGIRGTRASSTSSSLPEFSYVPPKYNGPSKEEVLSLRRQYLNPGAIQILGTME